MIDNELVLVSPWFIKMKEINELIEKKILTKM